MKIKNIAVLCGLLMAVPCVQAADTWEATPKSTNSTAHIILDSVTQTGEGHQSVIRDLGIGVSNVHDGQIVSFNSLKGPRKLVKDTNDVYTTPTRAIRHAGNTTLAQIEDMEVYFGEWASTNVSTDVNHVAFYSGKNMTSASAMPQEGTATYSIKGLNNYNHDGLMEGTFTANFASGTLAGSLSNSINTIDIAANINGRQFIGSATAGEITGTSHGAFFGDEAAALAGVANFQSNPELHTAFGGKKNSQ